MNEPPRLSVQDAADYVAICFTREYRAKCIAHFRTIHGDDYADQVKQRVISMFNSRKKK